MDEAYRKKVNEAKKLYEKARFLRGRLLNSVAVVECDIAVILPVYFCTIDVSKME